MKNRAFLATYAFPIVLLVQGCASEVGINEPPDSKQPSLAAERFSQWSTPANLGPVINSASNDQHPVLSKNGLSLYFVSNRLDSRNLEIWVAQRDCVECPWNNPQRLGPSVNSSFLDASPSLSRDEHQLFFSSQRSNGHCTATETSPCDRDLWVSYREDVHDDFAWEEAVNLGDGAGGLNSSKEDIAPSYFENDDDGLPQLFFNDGTLNANGVVAGGDIYMSQLDADGRWGPPALVHGINSSVTDQRPSISRNGRALYFFSTRGTITSRLWVATRETVLQPWSSPVRVPIGDEIPTTQPFIHSDADTETLLFVRQVPVVPATVPPTFHNDLFMSQRTVVGGQQQEQ